MAPVTVRAKRAEEAFAGAALDDPAAFERAVEALRDELELPADVPGGRPEYRLTLAQSALYKWWLTARADRFGSIGQCLFRYCGPAGLSWR